ncbi:Asp-tRNA(Asn)/Glu-tRNA(Gln) amidotransferase GatCAB subunit A [Ahniella affigens]|uniref:Glutamyl-tRNA(Gln) amidotransferase subunit A n=1 Tax=Ahniella affigens TaxID=2021234 RepID=A0A2P1PTI4_9GAMM|nr:Asp-tRNA(Asn)/Glu-tRNA(Gln) amidotransferase subunit GatA [Ahniella affigens]AVP98132.1 Asp-tRNA(Asn)/Glu-tRNA(Gln) amidotransferase GatCAB subunit A [Ahniella affigens]
MNPLLNLSAARALIAAGGAADIAAQALDRALQLAPAINALITVLPDDRVSNAGTGPLAGIPFVHKDVFCTEGARTTAGSKILDQFVPPYDATVVARLRAAGARCVGKANMDEFAMGSSNENSAYGVVRNPWDTSRVPGGSSGGSAAAVAAGIVPFATGSDTGGSVRQPAAFCGLTGLKPTYGRISRYGMIAYASSLDQAGVLARSVADCAEVLDVLSGHDPLDATSVDAPAIDISGALHRGVRGLRVGVVREMFGAGVRSAMADTVLQSLRALEAAGAVLVDISLDSLRHAIPAYYVIAPAEASSNLSRYDGVRFGHRTESAKDLKSLYQNSRSEGFGLEVKRRILSGTYVLSSGYYDAYYLRAQQVRRLIAADFSRAFGAVDVLAGPTTPDVAFKLGEKVDDPLAMYAADINTVAVNLAGLPAISLPSGFIDGLPAGLQLIAPAFAEDQLLAAGHALQQRTEHHLALAPGVAA